MMKMKIYTNINKNLIINIKKLKINKIIMQQILINKIQKIQIKIEK